jgi:exopolysaccharide biosynthesis polyprenyl glycosylphosphotransferase
VVPILPRPPGPYATGWPRKWRPTDSVLGVAVNDPVVRHHRRGIEGTAALVAARAVLGALAAAATTACVAAAESAAVAGAVSCGAFLTWEMIARAWRRPASHLPVVRVVHPLLVAAAAVAASAVVCSMLRVDGLDAKDWLLVLAVAGALSALTGGAGAGGARSRRVRLAFIGTREAADRLADDLEWARVSSYRMVGRVDAHGDDDGGVPVIAELGELRQAIVRERIDLLVVGGGVGRLVVFDALAGCLDLRVQFTELSAFYEDVFGNVPTAEINAAWFAHLANANARRPSPAAKRAFDVCLALVLGLLALPVVACAAVLVRAGGGPVIFAQQRIGESGRPFRLYKLRTMRVGSGDDTVWAEENDPRATPVGRFLRRSHIDELPQLWNVLRGEMSLVGPRPEQLAFVARLEATLPFYQRRHLIRPGLTGWAQVRCGYAGSDAGAAWKLCNDLYYVKYRSLGLDLLVLIETIGLVILGPGTAAQIPLTPQFEPDPPQDRAVGDLPSGTVPARAPTGGSTGMVLSSSADNDRGTRLIQ